MLETRIQVRVSHEELEEIKDLANIYGLSISDFIRYLITNCDKGGEE